MFSSVEMLIAMGFNRFLNTQFTVVSTRGERGLSTCFWSGTRYINYCNNWPAKRTIEGLIPEKRAPPQLAMPVRPRESPL